MSKLTPERKYELEQIHKGLVINPNVSNGQLQDSKVILELLTELDRLSELEQVAWANVRHQSEQRIIANKDLAVALESVFNMTGQIKEMSVERDKFRKDLIDQCKDTINQIIDNQQLKEENTALRAECDLLKAEVRGYQAAIAAMKEKNEKLVEQQNQKMVEVRIKDGNTHVYNPGQSGIKG